MSLEHFISQILAKCVSDEYVNKLTSVSKMAVFRAAFTSKDVDENFNYEWFELLGDSFHSAWLLRHLFKKFPHLQCSQGVHVAARLKIKYASKDAMALLADSCGFWPFIRASEIGRERNKKKLLEDVFEAFIGSCVVNGDDIETDFGSKLAFNVLDYLYSNHEFDLNNLRDAKTILKELCDKDKKLILKYTSSKVNDLFSVSVVLNDDQPISSASGFRKLIDCEQAAAKIALEWLGKHWPMPINVLSTL